jgi:hypothetical protein
MTPSGVGIADTSSSRVWRTCDTARVVLPGPPQRFALGWLILRLSVSDRATAPRRDGAVAERNREGRVGQQAG